MFRVLAPGWPVIAADLYREALWRAGELLCAGAAEVVLYLGERRLTTWRLRPLN